MRRALKYLFVFLGLIIVGVIAAVMLIPRERIVALAVDQVHAATGRELTLSGDLSPSFWPVLGVRTGPVTLSNADWAEAANMVSANAAEIGIELMPLLSGEINVTTLRLVDPVVALEINSDGQPNWEFGDGTAGHSGAGGAGGGGGDDLPKISLPEAVITNGKISFSDARTGQHIELSALDLTAGLESLDAPLRLNGSGLWNGKRATVEARVDTPSAVMSGAKATVRFSLTSEPATFSFEGDLKMPADAALPLVNGSISADLPNPSAAVAWATGASAPAGLADIAAVKLNGNVAATDAELRLAAKGSVGYKGRAVNFDLKANGAEGWLDRQAFAVAVSGGSDGLFQFSFDGSVSGGGAPAASGPLKLTISDLRGLAEWAGGAPLDAPAGTLESASLDTRLALGGDRFDLSDLTLRLDATTMTGEAGVDLGGARPMITARLNSGPLDLSPFMGGGARGGDTGSSGGAASGQGGWSAEPLDLSALRAVDAQVAIRAESVDLGDIEIGRSDIDARLRDGRLDLKIDRVDAYGGGMSGTITVLAGTVLAGEEAQLSTDLTISAVQLRPLLNALAGFDSLDGLGAFRIKLNGRGRSMDTLMRSLNGTGGLDLTDGAILGLNLATMVRNFTGGSGGMDNTDFSAVTGSFDITNGVLRNTDFSFLGPLLRVIGSGTVDIGGQAQNFRLEPTAVANLTGQGGALDEAGLGVFPILITGTWSNPSFRPDLTAAIEGFLNDPDKMIDTVTGLIDGADPAQAAGALLGAVTGGDGEGGSTGGLGDVLGGILGGGDSQGETDSEGGNQTGLLGGLLGSLGGGKDETQPDAATGTVSEDGSVSQPAFGSADPQAGASESVLGALGDTSVTQPVFGSQQPAAPDDAAEPQADSGSLAPTSSPLPAPARRQSLAALPDVTSGATEGAVDEALSVPAPQYTPEPEPVDPAAAIQPAPEPAAVPEPAPEPEVILQPQAEPQPVETEPQPTEAEATPKKKKRRAKGKTGDVDTLLQGNRSKDGGLSPAQILKSLEK